MHSMHESSIKKESQKALKDLRLGKTYLQQCLVFGALLYLLVSAWYIHSGVSELLLLFLSKEMEVTKAYHSLRG